MSVFEASTLALAQVFTIKYLAFLLFGVFVGLWVGVIPGLGGAVGMSLLLPFVFGMDPFTGMALLIGMTSVTHTADTFPSVLIGVPGSSGSQATVLDGYPLAQQGRAGEALGAAFFVSLVGGIIGAVLMLGSIVAIRPLVLAIGTPELFMLTVLGVSMVGILSKGSALAGVIAGCIGLLLGAIGIAGTAANYRFTFGTIYLMDGIPLVVIALGVFALPEMIDLLAANRRIADAGTIRGGQVAGIKQAMQHKFLIFRSAVLGNIVGIIPGLGGNVADWIAYGVAKQTCKDSHTFGSGDIRGVIAPESANNAKEGGTLVPTLLFGIPGGPAAAILLGGLILFGIRPGPDMVTTNLDLTLSIVWTLVLANIAAAAACFALTKPISRISLIPANKLVPFLFMLMLFASYQASRRWGDIIVFIVIGLIAWVMKQLGWPRSPIIVGFVLSSPAERYLFISMSRYGLDWLRRPGVIILAVIIIVLLVAGLRQSADTSVKIK